MKIRLLAISVSMILLLLVSGCFTGIESTPKIQAKDIKTKVEKSKSLVDYSDSISAEPFSDWVSGKRFRVTDSRIGIVFTSASASADSLSGAEIEYRSVAKVATVTGDTIYEILFVDPRTHGNYYLRVNSLDNVDIPYAIEMSLPEEADRLLRGRTLYVVNPIWYDVEGDQKVSGTRRHIPVKVDSVVAGNSVFPIRIIFTPTDESQSYSLYMSGGTRSNSTRNFLSLFSLTDPREQYPSISEAVWSKIIHSQVQLEMTRDECRLAWGAPVQVRQLPTASGMMEQWVYDDGKYLIFEDGYLCKYRQ